MTRFTTIIMTLAVSGSVLLYAAGREGRDEAPANGAASTLIARFLSSEDAPLTGYRAFRTLEAETRGGKMRARLTAWTSLDPAQGFQYSVVDETGSGVIRGKVLHAALEAERTLTATGEADKGALSASNYEFSVEPGDEEGLVRVAIHPKRRETMLLDGRVFLTESGADLARVEGYLVKRPSFWTREVHVVRRYERIRGIRVPVSMQSTARVLVAGRSTFSMTYEYESINGVRVSQPSAQR